MNPPTLLTSTTPRAPHSVDPLSLRRAFLLIPLALAWFALSESGRAADGGLPHFNTAEGDFALNAIAVDSTTNTGASNTAIGYQALYLNSNGFANTASGRGALILNTAGSYNTASGSDALRSNTTGDNNTGNGSGALFNNTTGHDNTGSGFAALSGNSTGSYNTANGSQTLYNNGSGSNNTTNGYQTLFLNQGGSYNTANGSEALKFNSSGTVNTACGAQALFSNNTGQSNTAIGGDSLYSNTSGDQNAAAGFQSLYSNTTGYNNTADGVNALFFNIGGHDNTGEGFQALLNNKGSNNVGLGANAGANLTTGSNNIDIGAGVLGAAGEAGKIRIGKQGTQNATYIAGIYSKTVASGSKVAVMIDSTGKLGTVVSSARYKEAIKPMDKASEAIHRLEPVSFRYKQELDPDGVTQFGLIAEQVAKVDPDLVVRDSDGKVNTVRYEAVNAMLLNEFLKEHRMVEEQEGRLQKQEAVIAQQQKQIEALIATVRRVSERVDLRASAPQIAANDD